MQSVTKTETKTNVFSRRWLASLTLVFVVFLTYWNSLESPFLFDDTGAVVNNQTIRNLGSLSSFNPPADGSTTTGRPVVNFSYAINYAISGLDVRSYHVLNIVIHALAALTLLGIARRTLTSSTLAMQFGPAAALLSFFIALLWAVHPLQTETVVCIAQRTESLGSLFYLLTLYCFIRATGPENPSTRLWSTLSVLSCLVGMGTKEIVATAPLLIWLYDRTFVAGTFSSAWRRRKMFYCALACTWLLVAWLAWRGGGSRGVAAGFGQGISSWNYLLQQCEALVLYLRLSVWPHPLVLDYGTAVAHSLKEVWLQGVLVVSLLAATLWALVRKPAAGFIGAWFFIILAPSSSVVPLVTQTMAEHRMYLTVGSVIVVLVLAFHTCFGRASVWILSFIAVVFSGLTIARSHDYRDVVSVWKDNIRKYPLNARAYNNLGWALQAQGKLDEANENFAQAVKLRPDYATAHYNWGVALLDQKRIPEAIAQFEAAVKDAPGHADAYLNLGNALMQVQRAAEAIPHYETALKIRPAADAHYNLGVALIETGRPAEAVQHLRTALKMNPQLPEAHYQLGRVAEQAGNLVEAETEYLNVLRRVPDHLAAHRSLGLLFARTDRQAAAAEHLRIVIRLTPGDAELSTILGDVLLLDGKPREAIAAFEESLRLRPDDAHTRESLQLARDSLH